MEIAFGSNLAWVGPIILGTGAMVGAAIGLGYKACISKEKIDDVREPQEEFKPAAMSYRAGNG